MKIIDRYVLKTQFVAVLLVLFVLLGLAGFISFLEEADKAGTGDFTMLDVLLYVTLKLPRTAVEMFPAATLIGSLLGLGALASRSELIAMRAAGVSIGRLAVSVGIVGLFLMGIAGFIGEWMAAPAENYAKQERSRKLNRDIVMAGEQGVWFRDGDRIINIAQWRDPASLNGVTEFYLDTAGKVSAIKQAKQGSFLDSGWALKGVNYTLFKKLDGAEATESSQQIISSSTEQEAWQIDLEPQTLELFSVEPEHLNSQELHEYIGFLNKNDLETQRYEVAFWSRLANILSIVFMSLLALPFVFGSLRKGNAGLRLFIGVGIGILYMSANRLLAGTGEVYGLNPFLSATLPTMILAVLTLIMIVRAK